MPQFTDQAVDQNQKLLKLLQDIALEKNATSAQISLAWMLNKKPWIVPIPGSRKVERMKENFASSEISLTADEIASIDKALDESGMSEVFGGSAVRGNKS
jgi:aryl-alcohol dehydrogenase-like predicted oxidoreductase